MAEKDRNFAGQTKRPIKKFHFFKKRRKKDFQKNCKRGKNLELRKNATNFLCSPKGQAGNSEVKDLRIGFIFLLDIIGMVQAVSASLSLAAAAQQCCDSATTFSQNENKYAQTIPPKGEIRTRGIFSIGQSALLLLSHFGHPIAFRDMLNGPMVNLFCSD